MSSGHETWDTRWADFALMVDTGEELKCHKTMLANCSPFFDAMLSSDCEETKNGKMKAKDYCLETVTTFLEQVYAIFLNKKGVEENKLTPELMRMCHMYQLQDLFKLTVDHLMKNIRDTNAVGLWFEAEKINNEEMKTSVINFIANKKKDIAYLADVDEAYKCPELMKSLVASLVGNDGQIITLRVGPKGTKFYVSSSDTVKRLKEIIYDPDTPPEALEEVFRNAIQTIELLKGTEKLLDHRTFESYGIQDGSKIGWQ